MRDAQVAGLVTEPRLPRSLRASAQTTGAPTVRGGCDEPTDTPFAHFAKAVPFGIGNLS